MLDSCRFLHAESQRRFKSTSLVSSILSYRDKRRGRPTYAEEAIVPRGSGFETKLQHERNLQRERSTHHIIRYGWKLMWRAAPEEMNKQKIQPSFSYDTRNCHKGLMPGWPKEVKNFTDNKMKRVLFACYKSGELTYPGLKSVRKSM